MRRTIYRCQYRLESGPGVGQLCKKEVYQALYNAPDSSRYCVEHTLKLDEEARKQLLRSLSA
jgi:hypothetical protein